MTASGYDDHGTLRDAKGEPMTYCVNFGGRSVPLMESQVWPEDMLLVNQWRRESRQIVKVKPRPGQQCDAESFAARIERSAAPRFCALPCGGDHADSSTPCSECGAVR